MEWFQDSARLPQTPGLVHQTKGCRPQRGTLHLELAGIHRHEYLLPDRLQKTPQDVGPKGRPGYRLRQPKVGRV
jgi:hypothetical protein